MGGSAGSVPTPDSAIADAALKQAALGEEWLQFSKDRFAISNERQAELDALTKRVADMQVGLGEEQAAWARADRERYDTVFRPAEDQFIAEAMDYATPERQEQAASEAKADIAAAGAAAQEAGRRQAASLGIRPDSGRWAGIEKSGELSTALATAGAANTARQLVRDKGLALKADVVNLGRGLPSQSAQSASLGLAAGQGAIGLSQAGQNLFNASTGIVGQGYAGAAQGYGNQAGLLMGLHGAATDAWRTQQNAASQNFSGLTSAIGLGAGLLFSSRDLKTDKAPVDEGEALEAMREMPVERWRYRDGMGDPGEHVGTYAEDFQQATGSGDGTTIHVGDAIGVTMAAVKDLDAKVSRIEQAVGAAPGLGLGAPRQAGAARKSMVASAPGLGASAPMRRAA